MSVEGEQREGQSLSEARDNQPGHDGATSADPFKGMEQEKVKALVVDANGLIKVMQFICQGKDAPATR